VPNGEAAMAEITLYGPPQAPFTVKVERALRLKGLDYELLEPQTPEDYRRWNPETGLLPVVLFGEERVHDSTRILERLDELYPKPPLLSDDPKLADAQRRLEDWCDETFFFYWLRLQRQRALEEEAGPQRFGLTTWLRDLALSRGPRPRRRDGLSVEVGEIVEQLGRRCDDLTNLLAGRPFFYGDRVGMADIAVYAILAQMRAGTFPLGPETLAERPVLVALMERVEAATGGGPEAAALH
jgi:glutathione S-transferase